MQGGVSGFRKPPPCPLNRRNFASFVVAIFFPDRDGAGAVAFSLLVAENAPVTRAVFVASGLLSVVFGAQRRARALGISYQVC
jgi:hypothetical protein